MTVTASASDDLAMAGVQFLLDGANLGAEVSGAGPTYTFNWNTTGASNGAHTLSARARDAANNATTSAAVNVNVANGDFTPPVVSVTAPAQGASVNGTVTVTASATDDVAMAGVQFLLDGANLGAEVTGSGPAYTFNWDTTAASDGQHNLSARARDAANNTTTAANITVTVSNQAPPSGLVAAYSFSEGNGTIVADSSGNNLSGTIVGASWTTAGKYGNGLSFNGSSSYVDLGNPAALQLTGSMTIEAWINAAANPGDDGQIVAKSNGTGWQFKTSPDTGPHTFGLGVSPGSGAITQRYSSTTRALGTWYHVAGVYDATAGTLSTYVNGVLDNGSLSGTIPTSQFNQNVNVNIGRRTGGFYFDGVIDEVRIYNRALSQPEIQIDMNTPIDAASSDTTPPTVAVTSPAPGADVTGVVTLTASASDDVAMAGVQFLLDGASLGAEVAGTGPTYTFNWNATTAAPGPHVLSARARDAANNTATSGGVNVTVTNGDSTPPIVSITAPAAGADVNGFVTVSATASDDVAMAGVQFLLDGADLGAEVTGAGPVYTFDWSTTTVPNGAHTLSARARDAANNVTTSTDVPVTVSNLAPSGLVAAYSFNEGSGTTAADSSGNNLSGNIVGASWTSGKYGGGLLFNGSSSYVDLGNPAALQFTGSMTIEAWVNAAANPDDDGQIVAKSNGTGWQFKTSPDTGPHTFGLGVSPGSGSITQRYSSTTRALGTWYHVAGVYDATAGTLSTYVNGVLDNGSLSGAIPASQFNQNVNVNIGRRTGGFYFDGVIDEVRIYDRALSQAEIQIDMNTPIP